MLANSDGSSVVVVLVVEVEGGATEVVLLAGRGEITVVVVALVAAIEGAVDCVLSLLAAQAVAASAAMARNATLRRCLIKIARAILMPSDNSTHQAAGQAWPDW